MENGPHERDEIISSVKKGILAETFTNGQVYIGAGDFTFYVKSGYLVEDGKITKPIKDINIIGNGPDVLTMGEPRNRGLYVYNSQVTIESNTFSNNFVSVLMDSVSVGNVNNNDFSSGSFGIYLCNSDNITANGNVFADHDGFPIYILNSENSAVVSNTITNPSNTPAGIGLFDTWLNFRKIELNKNE